jgi:hypothetical protein
MSIEFCINQYDEERCYSNGTIDLKSFLTALYSDEHPYGALMNLDGNKRIELADYAYDEQSGKETYDINFDRDTITRHEKGRQFKLNEMSKIPLGAAYSLMRFHGAGVPAAVSDCEYDEYNDMSGLFGNRDSEIKDRGFVIYSNDEYFEAYLNYLKNTGGYQFIRFVNVRGSQYIAFSQRGFDNIKSFLMQKLQTKRAEANRFEAEINKEFGINEPLGMSVSRQQEDNTVTVTLTADEMRRAYYIVHESFLTEDIQMKLNDLANEDARYEGLSDDIVFVNGVLSRYIDHSESEISYNDNIFNAIEHEVSKRENTEEQSDEMEM